MKVYLCYSDVESNDFMGFEYVDKIVATEALALEWMSELAEPEYHPFDPRCGLEDVRVGIECSKCVRRGKNGNVQTRRVQICEVEGAL